MDSLVLVIVIEFVSLILVEELDSLIDLVISVGGDGTFSEVMNGNLEREKQLVLAHLPVGTTNDIGHMYGFSFTNIIFFFY